MTRTCRDCGASIEQRGPRAEVCVDCLYQHMIAKNRAARRPAPPRFCCDCREEITKSRGASPRCEPCAAAYYVAHQRARNAKYYRRHIKRIRRREVERIRARRKNSSYQARERDMVRERMRRLRAARRAEQRP